MSFSTVTPLDKTVSCLREKVHVLEPENGLSCSRPDPTNPHPFQSWACPVFSCLCTLAHHLSLFLYVLLLPPLYLLKDNSPRSESNPSHPQIIPLFFSQICETVPLTGLWLLPHISSSSFTNNVRVLSHLSDRRGVGRKHALCFCASNTVPSGCLLHARCCAAYWENRGEDTRGAHRLIVQLDMSTHHHGWYETSWRKDVPQGSGENRGGTNSPRRNQGRPHRVTPNWPLKDEEKIGAL